MSKQPNAIDVQDIRKTYGKIEAVAGVSFEIPRERVFCILGPNGAGKTTLLRILTTMTRPDTGTALVEGFNILTQARKVRQLIGVVAQDNHFDRYLSIWHNLSMHAQMHGIPRRQYERRISELLEMVGLYARRNSLPDDLSGGMQRRVVLIRALIHSPQILFLDEPTTGLDPQGRLEIWHTIEQFKQTATVILTTHYMEEADRLADRIMMMNHGKVVLLGTPRELKQAISPMNIYELALLSPKAAEYMEMLDQELNNSDVAHQIRILDNSRLELKLGKPDDVKAVVNLLPADDILRIGRLEADLEDVFLSVAKPQAGGAS
jgi:ABC-2 type transport system ATP-binding protein